MNTDKELLEALVSQGLLTKTQAALHYMKARRSGLPLAEYLVKQKVLSAVQIQSAASSGAVQESGRLKVGQSFHGCQVLRRLGQGGMGIVFEVVFKGQRAALKVIQHVEPARVERFRREVEALKELNDQPNTVKILDAQYEPEPYLIMELLEGGDLEQVITQRELDEGEILKLMLPIAEALRVSHERGIIHRDLKPSNILLRKPSPKHPLGEPVLTDFGLVKDLSAETLTKTEEFVGTLSYTAPEQLTKAVKIDARADLWSFGVLLYRMRFHYLPFQAKNTIELVPQILRVDPFRNSNDSVNFQPLVAVIRRCLQKQRDLRYPDMGELIEDLNAVRRGQSLVHGLSATKQLTVFWSRRKWGLSLLLVSVLLGAGALLIGLDSWQDQRQAGAAYHALKRRWHPKDKRLEPVLLSYLGHLLQTHEFQYDRADYERMRNIIKERMKYGADPDLEIIESQRRVLRTILRDTGTWVDNEKDPEPLPRDWVSFFRAAECLKLGQWQQAETFLRSYEQHELAGLAARWAGWNLAVKQRRWRDAYRRSLEFTSLDEAMARELAALRLKMLEGTLVELLTSEGSLKAIQDHFQVFEQLPQDQRERALEQANKGLQRFFERDHGSLNEQAADFYDRLLLFTGRTPLRRPAGFWKIHVRLGQRAHRDKDLGRAVFHYCQAVNNNGDYKPPKQYQRDTLNQGLRFSLKSRGESAVISLEQTFDIILEMSRAGWHFDSMVNFYEMKLLGESGVFKRLVELYKYDPYCQYWQYAISTKLLSQLDDKQFQRQYQALEDDLEKVLDSGVAIHFKAIAQCDWVDAYTDNRERMATQPKIYNLNEMQGKLQLVQSLIGSKHPDPTKVYVTKARLHRFIAEVYQQSNPPNFGEADKHLELCVELLLKGSEYLDKRLHYSQTGQRSKGRHPSNPWYVLTQVDYNRRVCMLEGNAARNLIRLGQRDRALKLIRKTRVKSSKDPNANLTLVSAFLELEDFETADAIVENYKAVAVDADQKRRYQEVLRTVEKAKKKRGRQ